MNRNRAIRIMPFAMGFLVANLFAATSLATVGGVWFPRLFEPVLAIHLGIGGASLVGGLVAGYTERFNANKHSYAARIALNALIVAVFHACFVSVNAWSIASRNPLLFLVDAILVALCPIIARLLIVSDNRSTFEDKLD